MAGAVTEAEEGLTDPHFSDEEVERILQDFELLCARHGLTDGEKGMI